MPERVKKKLVELLMQCVSDNMKLQMKNSDRMTIEIHHGDIADHLIAHGVTVQEWISVEDRLPEDDLLPDSSQKYIRVITFIKRIDGTQTVDIHHRIKMSDDGTWEWMNFSSPGTITHWMPIPDLPKDCH